MSLGIGVVSEWFRSASGRPEGLRKPLTCADMVGPVGLEPTTYGLRGQYLERW